MTSDKTRPMAPRPATKVAPSADVAAFLADVKARPPVAAGRRGRLIFGLDATMSRQPTWDIACGLQVEMFDEASRIGGLDMQLIYFRGLTECRASPWMAEGARLGALMAKIDCRGGATQIGRVLRHAAREAEQGPVGALVFVGDAMEESLDHLCAEAGPLALRGIPAFFFQEGHDRDAERAFREIARLTKGAWCRFDAGSAEQLRALLRAAATYAAGGTQALQSLSASSAGARLLLSAMRDGQ
ncbi:VWA domain-containing protein [Ancylobacter radicis]|uniref:VWA domain-containing protein n=1 Tax=Ancylobacter radicis TaxID=2836179 RepID=A0ABS5R5X4_9HYPH|nr:VWA domain-containing protein [Ancylobacter radicis]MBS9476630.1 VWA domain-containing protein [Ancylobacter radicis]